MENKKDSKIEEPKVKEGLGDKEERMIGKKEGEQLKEAKVYYGMVKAGQLFLSYVMHDLRKGAHREMSSPVRKRLNKEIRKGLISEELVEYYGYKVNGILQWIKKSEELADKQAKEREKLAKKKTQPSAQGDPTIIGDTPKAIE